MTDLFAPYAPIYKHNKTKEGTHTMDNTSLFLLFGATAFIVSVLTFFIGRTTAAKKDGIEAGELRKDVDYIKKSIDRIDQRGEQNQSRLEGRCDETSRQILQITEIATKALESANSGHKRIDEHLEREHEMKLVKVPK